MQNIDTNAARHNLYAVIHKALRAMMGEALQAAGRCDWSDRDDSARVMQTVRELADFCAAHLAHENTFVHPAMEQRAPTTSMAVAHEHVEHESAIARLRTQLALIDSLDGAPRIAAGEVLYRQLAVFVGENYLHMHDEETRHNAVLWATHSEAELIALHQALVASLSPEESRQAMRWMLPNASHQERVDLLADLRAHAPLPVFEGTLAMLRGLIPAADWQKLGHALQLDMASAA